MSNMLIGIIRIQVKEQFKGRDKFLLKC